MSKTPHDAQEPTSTPSQRSSEAEPVSHEVSCTARGQVGGNDPGVSDGTMGASAAPLTPELDPALHELTADKATNHEPGNKRSIQRLAERLENVRSLTISSLFILLVVSLTGAVAWEILQSKLLIEPIRVPKELSDKGYTPEVIAQRLLDEIVVIHSKDKATIGIAVSAKNQLRDVTLAFGETDIELPGAALSLKSAIRYARSVVGLSEPRFGGEITRQDKKLLLRLRMSGGRRAVLDPIRLPQADLDKLLSQGAQEMMKLIDPIVLASYLHDQDPDNNKEYALKIIRYVLAQGPQKDHASAYYLKGNILRQGGELDGAIKNYQNAIKLDPNDNLAVYIYMGWADALEGKCRSYDANDKCYADVIDKYEMTARLDPENASAYSNWGNVLSDTGDYAGAIDKYRKASQLDPEDASAYSNWGNVLSDMEEYAGAIDKYQKASQLDPKDASIYYNWALALEALGDDAGAEEGYRMAEEIDPKNYPFPD